MVKIKIGEQIEGGIVVDEGLEPTMTVVTDGQLNLIPGAKVNILQSDGA
jgi:multidrug efflux pump subunit AcrA (membrane-fusion protein)